MDTDYTYDVSLLRLLLDLLHRSRFLAIRVTEVFLIDAHLFAHVATLGVGFRSPGPAPIPLLQPKPDTNTNDCEAAQDRSHTNPRLRAGTQAVRSCKGEGFDIVRLRTVCVDD